MHVWCAYCCGVAYCLGAVFVRGAGSVVGAIDLVECKYEALYSLWSAHGDRERYWDSVCLVDNGER